MGRRKFLLHVSQKDENKDSQKSLLKNHHKQLAVKAELTGTNTLLI